MLQTVKVNWNFLACEFLDDKLLKVSVLVPV